MYKYGIVVSNRLSMFSSSFKRENLKAFNMFADGLGNQRYELEFLLKMHCSLPSFFFNKELIKMNVDTIVVFDGHVRANFLEWLISVNPNKRVILWLWNTVKEIGDTIPIEKIPPKVEIWSYSEFDCRKYGFKYNTNFIGNLPKIITIMISKGIYILLARIKGDLIR